MQESTPFLPQCPGTCPAAHQCHARSPEAPRRGAQQRLSAHHSQEALRERWLTRRQPQRKERRAYRCFVVRVRLRWRQTDSTVS